MTETTERPHGTSAPCWCGALILFVNPHERTEYLKHGLIRDDDPHVVTTLTIPPAGGSRG